MKKYRIRYSVVTKEEYEKHERKSEEMIDILNSKDRINAGKTANPEGLYLKNVKLIRKEWEAEQRDSRS